MPTNDTGADISRSALVIVDMQNDFLHKDGNFPNI
jgi:nicotinamidase-related amidase